MIEFFSIFIIINLCSFFMMLIDKKKARKRLGRISENSFLLLSALGGFVGIFIAGSLFRHKTIKRSFQIKIIFGFLVYTLIVYSLFKSL